MFKIQKLYFLLHHKSRFTLFALEETKRDHLYIASKT